MRPPFPADHADSRRGPTTSSDRPRSARSTAPDRARRLAGASTAPELRIVNPEAGQVIEVVLPGPLDDGGWPGLEQRLLSLVRLRQPAELWLDRDGIGGLDRFPDGLDTIASALADVGGTLRRR